jgi:hypothetical protein
MDLTPAQLEKRPQFAALLLDNPANPFQAACGVFPDDTRAALWIATHWLADPVVLAEKEKLRNKGADLAVLPTKADQLRSLWELTQSGAYEDRIKAHKLYAEIKGHIDKTPAVAVNVNNNRVMVIRDQGSDAQWESKVARQQEDLINAAATRH